ncbi:hypothetical protein TB2_031524 [Malus domestica]
MPIPSQVLVLWNQLVGFGGSDRQSYQARSRLEGMYEANSNLQKDNTQGIHGYSPKFGRPAPKRKVRSLESNNQNVDSEKLENFHAKKAAFLRDVEELQSHRRVVEDFQDAESLCELASSSEEHGWKVEILINDDNSGNFKREVHDAGKRVGIEK